MGMVRRPAPGVHFLPALIAVLNRNLLHANPCQAAVVHVCACVCMVCRGSNACGALGTGDAEPRSAPTRVTSAATLPHGSGASSGPRRSKSGGPGARASSASATPAAPTYSTGAAPAFRAIAAGSDFVAAVGKADGQVYTWGNRCVVRVCGAGFVCLAVCTALCTASCAVMCAVVCAVVCAFVVCAFVVCACVHVRDVQCSLCLRMCTYLTFLDVGVLCCGAVMRDASAWWRPRPW